MKRRYSSSHKSNHTFSQVPSANIKRSVFDRSHGFKLTFDAGLLIPVYVDEALPGDTFRMSMTAFGRVATPIKPIMDNIILESFFFAVPNRLLWLNWERFCGYQDNPGDSTDFTIPVVTGTDTVLEDTIYDYMGLPLNYTLDDIQPNALPFRAHNLIHNEWFRDENLKQPFDMIPGNGPDPSSRYFLSRRGKRKDYFTGCLPWPQKGDSVDLPLGISAPVVGTGAPTYNNGGADTPFSGGTGGSAGLVAHAGPEGGNFNWADTQLEADLTNATSATINSLREAFQTQRLLERDARGGTRYTEIIRAHFNVVSPDSRLQRPEYLGGGRSYINFHSVAQNTPTGIVPDVTPQGNLSAYGTIAAMGHGFTQSFTEHMTILGFVCARADLTYQQGLERMWSRSTRFDYFWPVFQHLGEQEVLNKELYFDTDGLNDEVFGYQERYAEYRYKPSRISGRFRSTAATPIDIWHLAQEFTSRPVLNAEFIAETPPMDRIKAVIDEPDFIADIQFNLRCARPMPVYSVPGYIDHF